MVYHQTIYFNLLNLLYKRLILGNAQNYKKNQKDNFFILNILNIILHFAFFFFGFCDYIKI